MNNQHEMRLRFAPSPTGEIQLGNGKVAILNWLIARANNGKFFLRIEDTDFERSSIVYENKIHEFFKRMDIQYDKFSEEEPILRQSERINIYKKYAEELLDKKLAYYCNCPKKEDVDNFTSIATKCDCRNQNYTSGLVRFKVAVEGEMEFKDMIFGNTKTKMEQIEDFCLLRSDGIPTYHFCVVIDDHYMNINHVFRGVDHIKNTFKQILLYEAFGWFVPKFGHFPLIYGMDGKKLSKRNGDASVIDLLDNGYVPDGIFNALLRLCWGYKNQEIFTREEALQIFKISDLKKSPAKFDPIKLRYYSAQHLKLTSKDKLFNMVKNKYQDINQDNFEILYNDLLSRSCTYNEFISGYNFIFKDYSNLKIDYNKEKIQNLHSNLMNIEWNQDNLKSVLMIFGIKEASELFKQIIDQQIVPGVILILICLGKNKVLEILSYLI